MLYAYFLSKHSSLIRILKAEISETRLSLALKGRRARVFGQMQGELGSGFTVCCSVRASN